MISRRLYNVIEHLHRNFTSVRRFSIELLEAVITQFGSEINITGGRVWEQTPLGYRCIHEQGTRQRVDPDFVFPLAQIPLEEMKRNRFIQLDRNDLQFDVPAQQALGVDNFTAFPVDREMIYIISIYFDDGDDFVRHRDQVEDFLKVIGLFTAQITQKKHDDRILQEILTLAHQQQLSILPARMPAYPGFDIFGHSTPYTIVGGDYFQFAELFGPLLGIVLADVKGKGFNAAVQATALHRVLKVLATTNLKIGYKANIINQAFHDEPFTENLIAMVYGELAPDGRFYYTNIAHIYPIWYRSASDECIELDEGGPFLGLRNDSSYNLGIIRLRHDDILVLYTDGIVEIQRDDGEEYGRSRLKSLIQANRHLSAKALTQLIFDDTARFTQDPRNINDDRTVVVVKRTE